MAWVKLDDQFPDHPKVVSAGPLAAWLYVCGLAYANRVQTDGLIPTGVVPRLAALKNTGELAKRLVDCGLWELAEGGYRVHDYMEYQPSSVKLNAQRERTAARVDAWRKRRSNAVTDAPSIEESNAVTDASGRDDVTPLVTSPPARTRPGPNPVVERNLKQDPHLLPDAAVAASSGGAVSVLVSLSSDAREAVEYWRAAQGKRAPPKLNPTQAAKLEKAVTEVGLDWLRTGATWAAERGIPEFDKAVNAAYTARQNSERGLNGPRGGSGNGKPPAARGGGGSVRHI